MNRQASSKGIGVLLCAALFACETITPLQASTLVFGTGWGLPGTISFETPIGIPGGTPIGDTMFALDGQASVSKFHPDWGTLNSVSVTISGTGLYTYDYSPEIPETQQGALANSASFTATISFTQDDLGVTQTDSATGGNPGLGGTLVPGIEFMGSGSTSAFTGFGQVTLDLRHELHGNIFVDENLDLGPDAGYSGGLTGIYSGLMIVAYDYTPAGRPDGGPPSGQGACASCGPLPGDGGLDGFVGIDDLNLVLSHWNQNIVGWNNGDFSADGFIGVDDLNFVLANWNAGTLPPGTPEGTVPEPSTILLLAGSLLLVRPRLPKSPCITSEA